MISSNKSRLTRPAALFLALFLGFGMVGAAIAQAIRANSDSSDTPTYAPGIAYGVISEGGQPLVPPDAIYPDDNPSPSAALAPEAPSATFSYYFVSGATLVPRDSSAAYVYDGSGCVHSSSGSLIFNTDLQLPVGSEIKYLRLYYYDAYNSGYVTGYISQYPPSQSAIDLVAVSSSYAGTPGAGFVVSQRITQTVNYENYPYLLIGRPSNATSNLRVCGLRVAYYAPVTGFSFMPLIKK